MSKSLHNQIRLNRLEDWGQVLALAPQWENLVERVPTATVYQTFQWHACWWRAFGVDCRLWVITCQRDERLVAVAPMMIERGEIRFIGASNYASDYADFIVDPEFPETLDLLLAELMAGLPSVRRIRLSQFPAHSANASRVRSCLQHGTAPFLQLARLKAPTRLLGNAEEDRGAAGKASLRRSYNYFNKTGELKFLRCFEQAEVQGYLDDFFEQHIARRALTDSSSQFIEPAQRAFYRDLVTELLPPGWLRFDAVLYNGKPIAFHFGFEYHSRFIWYKPSFDIQHARKSPGEVLIKFLLEDAIERDLEEFDFSVGEEAFKYRFANEERYNLCFLVFRSRLDCLLKRAVESARRMAKKLHSRVAQARAS